MDGVMQAPGAPSEDPTGGFKIGDTAPNSPSKAEVARQERLKREG